MNKFLINFLLKRIFRYDFIKDLDESSKIKVYLKMKDEQIIRFLKYRYTNNVVALAVADKDKDIIKGRIVELLDLLNSIENIEDTLENYEEYVKKSEGRNKILQPLKDKLFQTLKVGKLKINKYKV